MTVVETETDDDATWQQFWEEHDQQEIIAKLAALDDERAEWVKIASAARQALERANVRDFANYLLRQLRPSHSSAPVAYARLVGEATHDELLTSTSNVVEVELRDGRRYELTLRCTRGAR